MIPYSTNTRRGFLQVAGISGAATLLTASQAAAQDSNQVTQEETPVKPLTPPTDGIIRVAFCISTGANVIDTAGPWEVFQDVSVEVDGKMRRPFRLFTVSEKKEPLRMSGGLEVLPTHTFDDAPQPHVIVVPAQSGGEAVLNWLRKAGAATDITMSVCTGAMQLGLAGLLDGKEATTHHAFFDTFAEKFPNVTLHRGTRFVDNGTIATAGGLTAGFDMALHVVRRYFGEETAAQTAEYMEYTGYTTHGGIVAGG